MQTFALLAARRAALAVALLLGPAGHAVAADASLELFYGPDQPDRLTLRKLEVKLDGLPLPVPLPAKGSDPTQAALRGPLSAGAHRLDVTVGLDSDPKVFTYLEGTRFTMRGVLQLDAQAGDVVEVRARVIRVEGVTVKWEDRARLALDATIRRVGQPPVEVAGTPAPAEAPRPAAAPVVAAAAAAAAAAPPPAPTPSPAPAAEPSPAAAPVAAPVAAAAPRAPEPAVATPCKLSPVRFAFDSSTLSAESAASLDAFAACLAGSARPVRVEGHCDSHGPDVYNEWLGAQRAAAAARRLRERGVAPERITVRSMSAGSPTCADGTKACSARNRRVEATVLE
jgi:outer membrane protein OmpA-like peptidoglycan-associated protein